MLRRLTTEPEPRTPLWQLRRGDQAVVGALAFLALAALGIWLGMFGNRDEELVELEQLPQTPLQFQLDINTADWPELAQLPGIGETLARRIVEHRVTKGPFTHIEDLRHVRGIGPKTLERIRPYLSSIATAAETYR